MRTRITDPLRLYQYAVAGGEEPSPGPKTLAYIAHLEATITKAASDRAWEAHGKRCEALGINP